MIIGDSLNCNFFGEFFLSYLLLLVSVGLVGRRSPLVVTAVFFFWAVLIYLITSHFIFIPLFPLLTLNQ